MGQGAAHSISAPLLDALLPMGLGQSQDLGLPLASCHFHGVRGVFEFTCRLSTYVTIYIQGTAQHKFYPLQTFTVQDCQIYRLQVQILEISRRGGMKVNISGRITFECFTSFWIVLQYLYNFLVEADRRLRQFSKRFQS